MGKDNNKVSFKGQQNLKTYFKQLLLLFIDTIIGQLQNTMNKQLVIFKKN